MKTASTIVPMLRALPLIFLLLSVACDKKAAKPELPPKPKKPVVPATTGNPRIRGMREDILEEVEKAEKEMEGGKMPERRLVDEWKKGADHCIEAAQIAVDAEAVLAARHDLTTLRQKQADLDKKRIDIGEGIAVIKGYLGEIERGGKPPEGFTEGELKDRLGGKLEEARALEKEDEELRTGLTEKENLLAQGKVPPQGETLHTHELEAAKELKTRVEALEARLK